MNYKQTILNARENLAEGGFCRACDECNGRACRNTIPGPGAKGTGDGAMLNYDAWKKIRVNLDTICENAEPDMSLELFGRRFKYPFFAGPIGAVALHIGPSYDDESYNDALVSGCAEGGVAAFTGDGTHHEVFESAARAIAASRGVGVPTIKPWDFDTVMKKLELVRTSRAFAAAMDIDGAGLPFLKNCDPPAGSKTVGQLREIIGACEVPFIIKGIMTPAGALKAQKAGAAGIVVSNHGGRVLDQCAATADVLPSIAKALDGSGVKILVDGGLRCGADVFKAIALGADGVIIARPFAVAVYGGGAEGVRSYIEKIGGELEDTMRMCGVKSLAEISQEHIFKGV